MRLLRYRSVILFVSLLLSTLCSIGCDSSDDDAVKQTCKAYCQVADETQCHYIDSNCEDDCDCQDYCFDELKAIKGVTVGIWQIENELTFLILVISFYYIEDVLEKYKRI